MKIHWRFIVSDAVDVKDDHLDTDTRSASNCVNEMCLSVVTRVFLVEIVLILMRYRVSFITALIPQLQL